MITDMPSTTPFTYDETPCVIEWRMEGNHLIDTTSLLAVVVPDAKSTGEAIAALYKTRGILAVSVHIEGTKECRTVIIMEGVIHAFGRYAAYLPEGEVLTQAVLDTAIAQAQDTARANNESLSVRVGRVEPTGITQIIFAGTPNTSSSTQAVSLTATSLGPRYSGADVVTLSGYALLGQNGPEGGYRDGVTMDASLTHALSDLRDDSRGGRYLDGAWGISKATPQGLFSARLSASGFKVGGVNLPLDQRGSVDKFYTEWSKHTTPTLTPFVGLSATRQTSEIGTAHWNDDVTTTSLKAGVRGQHVFDSPWGLLNMSGDATLEQGLSAERSFNSPSPLLGEVDAHYTVASFNTFFSLPLGDKGASVVAALGAQQGSNGTPSGSQFYAGGPDRGVSYHSGIFAGPSGYYGSMLMASPILDTQLERWIASFKPSSDGIHSIQAFAGVDGASVDAGPSGELHTLSAQLGVRFAVSSKSTFSFAYTAPLSGREGDASKFSFFFNTRF